MSKRQAVSGKRQVLREQRLKRERQQRMYLIIGVGVVAIIIAALLISPSLAPVGNIVKITPNPRPQANMNSMGDPNAPVKLVEYSDYQCPYCKRFNDETEKLVEDTYIATGKVYFTYIPYGPNGQYIGPESKDAAMAAFCAGDQGKFWEYHDMLFANQTGENVGDYTAKRLEAFADALGLNTGQFRSCFNGNKFADTLNQGLQQGKQAQIGGTPSFLINGTLIEGAFPFTEFQQKIEAALAAAGSNK
jgi:protein-disulfide isomerase